MKDRSHDDAMVELFRDDPAVAAAALNAILADGDQEELLVMLRQMAKEAGLERHTALPNVIKVGQSRAKQPDGLVIRTMGFRLAVEPLGGPDPLAKP